MPASFFTGLESGNMHTAAGHPAQRLPCIYNSRTNNSCQQILAIYLAFVHPPKQCPFQGCFGIKRVGLLLTLCGALCRGASHR